LGGIENISLCNGVNTINSAIYFDADANHSGSNGPGRIELHTNSGNSLTERLRIDSSGTLTVTGKTDTDTLTIGSDTLVSNTLAQLNVSHAASSSSTYPFIIGNGAETAANARGLLIKYTGSSGNWSANQGGDYLRCTADGEGYVNSYISGAGLGQFRGGVRFGTDSAHSL